jgi:mono/diheme cytochrome c family protein
MFINKVGTVIAMVSVFGFTQTGFAEEDSSIARGGKLYDKWYKVIEAEKPKDTHPAWPASNTKKEGDVTHRCKSCHGWDLKGKDGAYASGSYKTGIAGLTQMQGKANSKIIAVMKDPTHGYDGKMSEQDFNDLANFVTKGQIDMDTFIDPKTKKVSGNAKQGERYFNTVCAGCHEKSGLMPKDMAPLGKLANDNPWEIIQKILNGQPDEKMPAMRAFDLQVSVDILAHLQTLPKE